MLPSTAFFSLILPYEKPAWLSFEENLKFGFFTESAWALAATESFSFRGRSSCLFFLSLGDDDTILRAVNLVRVQFLHRSHVHYLRVDSVIAGLVFTLIIWSWISFAHITFTLANCTLRCDIQALLALHTQKFNRRINFASVAVTTERLD